MRKLLILVVILGGAFLAGCGEDRIACISPGSGLVDTPQQRARRHCNINDLQLRMAVDDCDYLWLRDRPSYLTYWYLREAD